MLAAHERRGDDYQLHRPEAIAADLRALGWVSQVSVHEEPQDAEAYHLYPTGSDVHATLSATPEDVLRR